MCEALERGMEEVCSAFHYELLGFKRVVGREGVSYHIRLIINLESYKLKSLHLGTTPWT